MVKMALSEQKKRGLWTKWVFDRQRQLMSLQDSLMPPLTTGAQNWWDSQTDREVLSSSEDFVFR